ncbi:hypothetical protein BKG93_08955 [Rodentibacter ratti]|uniref:Uncharacterized protein n=1 Tax=Rodentibacter ratti TaxID=1906745 RepID=A0A1V3L1X9_9PAST|nr:hypothetical protein [Rodentibacter ratti]OOF83964.1 hypothetical protein BKG93_08955 [Rodentibacter ratti]
MDKLKEIIKVLRGNKKFEEWLGKLFIVFKSFKQNAVINNFINKTVNFIVQHKIISTIVLIGIITPAIFSSNVSYPEECKGLEGQASFSGDIYSSDATVPILAQLAYEEDPTGAFAKRRGLRHIYYDDAILSKLFTSKYSKLLKTVGKESAELYREQLVTECSRQNKYRAKSKSNNRLKGLD